LTDYFWELLEAGGEHPALIDGRGSLSYAALVERIQRFTQNLRAQVPEGVQRPLVLLEATNEVDSMVAYLACLRARYPVILVAEGQATGSAIARSYEPNLIIARAAGAWQVSRVSHAVADLHPELAVLLSTSGTTGAAKLVRLSAANLQANARAITSYLGLTASERGITALPYHYSYGMSVLHIHLLAHASLVLTPASVVDEAFWPLARRHGVTSLALVPTQFELLEQRAFSKATHLPNLRYVTQAGGKLDAKLASSFARLARSEGWRLFLMYGQTEAGPRMSYVPPEDAERWHHTIGRPVEGGCFRLLAANGEEISNSEEPGELVYAGPNVMLGYATQRADLGLPAGPSVLRTGDVAQRTENGYFRIVGRTSRFIKLFGLRISLDEVESTLRAEGHRAYASGSDEALVIFLGEGSESGPLRAHIARRYGWPERVVHVVRLDAPPLLPSGKVDYRELARRAAALARSAPSEPSGLAVLLCSVLGEANLDLDKSFVDYGGSSLSHLEVQLFCSKRGGAAPDGWERLPLRELLAFEHSPAESAGRWQRVPADLIARTVAILAVLALHSTDWQTGGGSILLLVLAGHTLARFQSEVLFRGHVAKTLWSMLGRVVGVYYACIAVAALKFFPFDVRWFLLGANFASDIEPEVIMPYWFVSTYVQIIALSCLPFLIPRVRARVKAAPFQAGMIAWLALGAAIECLPLHGIYYNVRHHHPLIALELLVAGWVIFFARTHSQKLLASVGLLLVWFQNFGLVEPNIAAILLGGSLSVLWGLAVALPPRAVRSLLAFGSLSLFVYIAHVPILYALARFVPAGGLCFAVLVGMSIVGGSILERVSTFVAEHATHAVRKIWTASVSAESIAHSLGADGRALMAEDSSLEQVIGPASAQRSLGGLEHTHQRLVVDRSRDGHSAEATAANDTQDSPVLSAGGDERTRRSRREG
jgi:acyl-CoA synthetase (AMP-forming)/AMP-acid ligase II